MAVTQTTRTVLDFGAAYAQERSRTTSRGTKERYTIDIKSEPVSVNLDPRQLGAPVAEAIRDALRAQIEAIEAPASISTLQRRVYAEAAVQRGARWAKRRYSGGRTGASKPNSAGTQGRLFNDSGRFARGLFVRATRDGGAGGTASWTVNVPANRLDKSTFSEAQFGDMLRRLGELVPAIAKPGELASIPEVAEAINQVTADAVRKGSVRSASELIGALRETVSQVAELGEALGTITEE